MRRLNFLRLVSFSVAEVRRAKQHCRTTDFRFDQSLRGIQFKLSQRQTEFRRGSDV